MAIKNRKEFTVPPLVAQNISTSKYPATMSRGDFLLALSFKFKWYLGVELGLWQGDTIHKLLARNPELHMIGVDLWATQPDNPGPEGYEGWDHNEHEMTCRRRCAPYSDRAVIIKSRTVDAAKYVADRSLDFVFIDADHSEEGCYADIIAWLPKLKSTGYILGHDINWPTVKAAVTRAGIDYRIGPNVVWFAPVSGKWDNAQWG